MLVIGSKKYLLNLSNILDKFNNNIRVNLSLPNENNGSIIDALYVNNHVYQNFYLSKFPLQIIKKKYSHVDTKIEYLKKLREIIDKKMYTKILCQFESGSCSKENKSLYKLGIKNKLKKQGKCGLQSIIQLLIEGKHKNIIIYGFSLNNINNNTVSIETYNCDGHSDKQEFLILKEMHQKKLIDVTLCMLEYFEEPILDCRELEPTEYCLDLLLEEFKEIKIRGDKFDDSLVEKNNWTSNKVEDLIILKLF